MKPTSNKLRGFVAATLGLTVSLTLPVVFSGHVLLAQAVPSQNAAFRDPFPVSASVAPPQTVPPEVRLRASQMLHAARKAVASRDIATAERLVSEVNAMQLTYQENEDQPALVQRLIQQHRQMMEMRQAQGDAEHVRRQYAQFNLVQAHTMLLRGELDLAVQLTQEAANQRVQYSQADRESGLEPNVMAQQINDARRVRVALETPAVTVQSPQQSLSQAAQGQLEQAIRTLQEARMALEAGQLDQAERLVQTVAAFGLSESAFPNGNTPNRLRNEIAARRQGIVLQTTPQPVVAETQSAVHRHSQDQSQILQTAAANHPTLAPPIPVPGRTTPFIDEAVRNQQIIQSQFASDVIQQLSDARRLTQEQRRPDAALDILHNLKRRVEQTQQLDTSMKQSYLHQIDRAIEDTVSFRNRYSTQARQNEINEAVLAELRHEAERFQHREEQLAAMFREHKKLLDEQRFEEALRIAQRANEIAPDEPAVQIMLTLSQFAWNVNRSHDVRDLKAIGFNENMLAVDRASIAPDFSRSSMIFPDSWADITRRRQATNQALQQQRPESERRILQQLDRSVSLNVDQPLTLEQALNMLCGQVDLVPFIDRAAFQEADIQTGIMITMPPANGIKMRSVLRTILDQHGLDFVVKNEILNITTQRRAQGAKYPWMHYIGDIVNDLPMEREVNPMEDAMYRAWMLQVGSRGNAAQNRNNQRLADTQFPVSANGMMPNSSESDPNVLAQWGGGGMGGMGGMGGGMGGMGGMGGGMGMGGMGMGGMGGGMGMGGMGGMGGGMGMGRMGGGMGMGGMGGMGMSFGSIMQIIQSVIEPDSWFDGDAYMDFHFSTQSLAIRQTEEVHSQIEDLLNQIRKMNDLQVAIEVRYISLSDSFFERMGTSFDVVFRNNGAFGRVSQSPSNNILSGSDGEQTAVQTTQANNIVVGLRAPGEFTVDASIPFHQDSFGITIPAFGGYNPAAGISTGFALLSDIETYFFITAAQGDQRSSVMEAPKVMLQNGQMGSVSDYTQMPFVTSVVPVVADFAIGYQPIITTLNQGNVLRVQATASNDRQSVRLALNPLFTTLVRVETFRFVGDDEQSEETQSTRDDASAIAPDPRSTSRRTTTSRSGITIQQPIIANFSVQTTVTCPDGGTVLLGGIKRLSEGRIEAGTPILNKIPYIQRLFANTAIGRDTQSVMIMVTPRIIIQEEEENFITGGTRP